jgi:hypothetical protein
LKNFLTNLRNETGNKIEAQISWKEPFVVDVGCKELSTTTESLNQMQADDGWKFGSGKWPSQAPQKEEQTTVELVKP